MNPKVLLPLAGVLVAITTAVVALRGVFREAPHEQYVAPAALSSSAGTSDSGTAERETGTERGLTRETAGADGLLPGAVLGDDPDPDRAAEFHEQLVSELGPRLRLIGFRPTLLARQAREPGEADLWTISSPGNFPVLRLNAEITRAVRDLDGSVFLAVQDSTDLNRVTMYAGAGDIITDEIVIHRKPHLRFKGDLAIVIDDVGYRRISKTRGFIALPQMVTLAILPHHPSNDELAEEAVEAGKEVMLHLPMEPQNAQQQSLEPTTLMISMADDELMDKTVSSLEAIPCIVGVNNHMGSRATEDPRLMRAVVEQLGERELFFLDSRTTAESVAEDVAREHHVLTGRRNMFLDNSSDVATILAELRNAAEYAERNGAAIAIGHDREATLTALARELPILEAEGFRICSVRELMR